MSTKYVMDDRCFACGINNRNGLRLNIIECAEGVEADVSLPAWSQGYRNVVHGGIIATILDEMGVWAAYKKGYACVTAQLDIRIRKAMNIDEHYRARGKVINTKYQLVVTESSLFDKNMEMIASAQAKLMRID